MKKNSIILQSSANYYNEELAVFSKSGIQIKLTSFQYWHVTQYEHVTH